jgi:protein-S-isoprenylcysteine O-methyltransferase Ste14
MNTRGELWVMTQVVLLGAIALVPRTLIAWPEPLSGLASVLGLAAGVVGVGFLAIGGLNLGANLTIFPRPKDDGTLTQTGLYSIVRHPIYCGVILMAVGWSLLVNSMAALLLSFALIVFFDRKAAREEVWLMAKFPEYVAYRQRVKKLLPFLY